MFGNIAAQIAAYYGIAALLIPFGYGHVARRRWARPLALALIGCWLVLHIPILFNGLFSLFGRFLTGLPGIVVLDGAILLLTALTWGTFWQKAWAWWGSLASWGAMTLFVMLTFASTGCLALFFGLSLLATVILLAVSGRHFGDSNPAPVRPG